MTNSEVIYQTSYSMLIDIDGNKSSTVAVRCGLPQGSILGPLLYLIYANDIGNSC